MEMAKIEYFHRSNTQYFLYSPFQNQIKTMYNIRRFVGSGKELQELKKALETNDTKIIQKYIDLTRQRMIKHNRTNQLKTFEHILKQPRKTKPRKQVKKTTDLWKMFKLDSKPRK
jgi:hypothetical protein